MGFLQRVFPGRRAQDTAPPPAPPPPAPPPPPLPRTDLTQLLGRSIMDAFTQVVCHEYGLVAMPGARVHQSRELGVELAVDDQGTVTTILLYFRGINGFAAYPGPIPGRAGTIAKRSHLWSALGRPGESTDPHREQPAGEFGPADQWWFPTFAMHAQYALDGEALLRLTLRH